jgi:hypothetical protein
MKSKSLIILLYFWLPTWTMYRNLVIIIIIIIKNCDNWKHCSFLIFNFTKTIFLTTNFNHLYRIYWHDVKQGTSCHLLNHILRNVVCYQRRGGWLVSPSKCQNQYQLILDCEVILTLEFRIFKVWHIGCSNIFTLFFYVCFLFIIFWSTS